MPSRNSLIDSLKRIVGVNNVLTDAEDLYVYSFEHIFREQQHPRIDAVVKTRSAEETEKVVKLANKEGLTAIRRGSLKPAKSKVILIDDTAPPDLTVSTKETKKKPTAEDIREIHRAGHGTFRNFALALKTFFLNQPASQCQECLTCSGYCTVAPSFNNIETWSSKGRTLLMRGLAKGELTLSKKLIDVLYTCSTCGLCFAECFQDLKLHEAIIATRRHITEKGLAPEMFRLSAKNISENGDPSGMPINRRLSWTQKIPKLSLPKKAEVLYWVGCMTGTRTPNVAKAVANVLNHAKVDFTMLSEREGCCGYVLLKTGLWDESKNNAVKLVKLVKETKAEILVTPCAGCYHAFNTLYPEMLDVQMPCEVLHSSQLAERLVKDGALEFEGGLSLKVTYHDPCSLGRHENVYDPPRNILKAIPNLQFFEMPLSRSRARCCGGGGGLWTFKNEVSMNSAWTRLANDVAPLDVDALVTACPLCHLNLHFTSIKKSVPTKIVDIMEVVESALQKSD